MAEEGSNYPERRDVIDRQRQGFERVRKLDIAAIVAPAGAGASSYLTADGGSSGGTGGWVTGSDGAEAFAAFDSFDSSADVSQLDDHTFELPPGIYFVEWFVYAWTTFLGAAPPWTGDGWVGYHSGPYGHPADHALFQWVFDTIRRERATLSADRIEIGGGSGSVGRAVEMYRGLVAVNEFGPKLTLAMTDIPEVYGSTALDTASVASLGGASAPEDWHGEQTLTVVRCG